MRINKPYFDRSGVIWLKSGSDKRRVNSKEELRRLSQVSDQFHADELPTESIRQGNSRQNRNQPRGRWKKDRCIKKIGRMRRIGPARGWLLGGEQVTLLRSTG
jgi:hypothetical protein